MAQQLAKPTLAQWQQLAPRERWMLLGMAGAVGGLLLWFLLLAPAVKTLRTGSQQLLTLEQQLTQVRSQAKQIQALAAADTLDFDAAYRALSRSTADLLPEAQLRLQDGEVTVQLQAVNAHHLAAWLQAVRHNAKAVPQSAQLQVVSGGASGHSWSGELVLRLPPKD